MKKLAIVLILTSFSFAGPENGPKIADGIKLSSSAAWDANAGFQSGLTGKGVGIAIIDRGINPDLQGRKRNLGNVIISGGPAPSGAPRPSGHRDDRRIDQREW